MLRVTTDQKNMKMRNVKPITNTVFSQKPFILYIITETVPFNYNQIPEKHHEKYGQPIESKFRLNDLAR